MSENLKNLLIVLAIAGIIIFIVNRKNEKFTTVSKLISGIDNMTEKELDSYEKTLMDGHDLKILKKFNKENEILEKQLNVKYNDEEDEDSDSDDSHINPLEEEMNYADVDDEFHLDGRMNKKCKKKKLNSNLSSEMIIGNKIDETLYDETNNNQIEDEDNFRKFLSEGKNTIREKPDENYDVNPYIEDELQKFIISEEDEYQNSKATKHTILSEKKIAKSKFFERDEEMESDEELDEEQIFVDPKKALVKKNLNKVETSKIIKDNLDQDEDDISDIIDEVEQEEVIKRKKIRNAVAINNLDEQKEEKFNEDVNIPEEPLLEEELKPKRKIVKNLLDEDLINNFNKDNSELYVEEEDESQYALFEEETPVPKKIKKIKKLIEEEKIYIDEEKPYMDDEDYLVDDQEDETHYALFNKKPKMKIKKIIDEELPNIGYKEIEEELDDEMLQRKIYHKDLKKKVLHHHLEEEEEEEYYPIDNDDKIEITNDIDYDTYFDEQNNEIIPQEDELKMRFTKYEEENNLTENKSIEYEEEDNTNYMPYQEEEQYVNYEKDNVVINNQDYNEYYEEEDKNDYMPYQDEEDNNDYVTYQEEDNNDYVTYQEEDNNDYMPYQEEEEDNNDYVPYQEEEEVNNEYMPYQEEEQYDYVNEEDDNNEDDMSQQFSQQFPSKFSEPVSEQTSGLDRIKNVLQQEMSRQEMEKSIEDEENEILDTKSKKEMKNRMKHQVKCGAFIDPKYKSRITGCGTKQEMMLHKPNNEKLNSLRNRSTEDVPKAIRDVYNEVIPKYNISKDQTCQHVQKGVSMKSCSGVNKPLMNNIYANDRCFDKYSHLRK